jgi:hypothetical protein
MRKIALALLTIATAALVACGTAGGAPQLMKCSGCGVETKSYRMCDKDRMCAACDRCMGKCAGCGGEAKSLKLCAKDQMCPACDKCAR